MNKIKIGIVGGAGYTAGELLRILVNHPGIEFLFIQSDSHAGEPVGKIHQDLFFMDQLTFTDNINAAADVVFLCKGHGESIKLVESGLVNKNARIIDLSQDFRLETAHPDIQKKYGKFIYGLPELNRPSIVKAKNIANPGCFATCIQLGLLPLANGNLLGSDVHISAVTGSTGAGQKLSSTSHFSWRNENMSVYKAFNHQHLDEISQSIHQLQPGYKGDFNFIPYRGNFTRGIIATMYTDVDINLKEAYQLYADYYREAPFVKLSEDNINLKQVVNTNYCQLYMEKMDKKLMIVSTIDNLVKGASGQAVQNMNLLFGFDETTGLNLKGSGF